MSRTRTVAAAVERFAAVAARSVMAPLLTPFPVGLFWRRDGRLLRFDDPQATELREGDRLVCLMSNER